MICITSSAQSISDSEFQWKKNLSCLPEGTSTEIFVKVEQEPVLKQFNTPQFENFIYHIIDKFDLKENQSGILKLKLLFARNQNICVKEIGTKSLVLSEIQMDELSKALNSINQFEPGKQRNITVNCLGILYINILKGKVDKIKNVNFRIL